MVHDQIGDNANAAVAGRLGKLDEITERTVPWVDIVEVCDIVTVIPARRRKERLQPDTVDIQSNWRLFIDGSILFKRRCRSTQPDFATF
jgi:hypothetical protein